jgi:hypothetical protein
MKAYQRALEKQDNILYKKVGRKYIPVNDPYAINGLREGFWLVKVAAGSTSIRQQVYPNKAEIQAAAKDKADQLVEIIRKASEARPKSIPLSEQAKADWDWFISRNGKEFNTLEYPSIQENAEKIIEALLQK